MRAYSVGSARTHPVLTTRANADAFTAGFDNSRVTHDVAFARLDDNRTTHCAVGGRRMHLVDASLANHHALGHGAGDSRDVPANAAARTYNNSAGDTARHGWDADFAHLLTAE